MPFNPLLFCFSREAAVTAEKGGAKNNTGGASAARVRTARGQMPAGVVSCRVD